MKKCLWVGFWIILLFWMAGTTDVYAVSDETEQTVRQQAQAMSADRLWQSLPPTVQEGLASVGVTSLEDNATVQLSFGKVFTQIVSMLSENSRTPFCGLMTCLGIILLCALTEGVGIGLSVQKLNTVQNAVAAMCICTAMIVPLTGTIHKAAELINGGAAFMLLYVPILTGLMMSAGHEVTGASYYTTMMTAGNAVSLVSAKLIVPMMNVFLALSVTSSVSPKMRLTALCESVYKIAKWVLVFVLSVFVAILSVNSMVTSSMDHVSQKALRFTVSSFVPVVGGVLGEALNTFNGSLELLKTGAGVFVIVAAFFWLLPVLLECILWQFSLFLLSGAADMMGITAMSAVFKTVSKAAAMLTALLAAVLVVFVISTVIILLASR